MAEKVRLDFTPPDDPGIIKLHVYESSDMDGPYNEIDSTTAVGTYPDYISWYTTQLAGALDDWFQIAWEDSGGALTDRSEPVQGGTTTYVGELVKRVMLRMPSADERVVTQEAEAVIEEILRVDPYSSGENVKYKTWNGMTVFVMARVQLSEYAAQSSTSESFTAGLVSMKSGTTSTLNLKSIRDLMEEAGRLLGFSTARIAQMTVPEIAGGLSQIVMADISRLQIDVA